MSQRQAREHFLVVVEADERNGGASSYRREAIAAAPVIRIPQFYPHSDARNIGLQYLACEVFPVYRLQRARKYRNRSRCIEFQKSRAVISAGRLQTCLVWRGVMHIDAADKGADCGVFRDVERADVAPVIFYSRWGNPIAIVARYVIRYVGISRSTIAGPQQDQTGEQGVQYRVHGGIPEITMSRMAQT